MRVSEKRRWEEWADGWMDGGREGGRTHLGEVGDEELVQLPDHGLVQRVGLEGGREGREERDRSHLVS